MKKNLPIIQKLKEANLVGRGGAGYPVWQKWQAVFDSPVNTLTTEQSKIGKFVLCNCSEGEPGVSKDGFLIEKYSAEIINGMKIALDYLGAKKGYFFINETYYKKYNKILTAEIKKAGVDIELFKKPHSAGYIAGEESTLINVIEGEHAEPRLKPPYPVSCGLWGQPTLVNNVETFYDICRVMSDNYAPTRAYSILGDCLFPGVYELPISYSIAQVLETTHNFPKFDFCVQVGGDGSGEVLNHKQLNQPATGAGSLHIYSITKHKPLDLIKWWANFFLVESCGKCTPCREGTNRLALELSKPYIDWKMVGDLLTNLRDSSFCALGMSVPIPMISYIKNVVKLDKENILKILPAEKAEMCKIIN